MVITFAVYSVAGWVGETVVCSALARRPVDRGLLRGPLCALYGFSAVAALLLGQPVAKVYPPLTFVVCLLGLTALKYVASWVVEKVLAVRLWDKSTRRLNLGGRVYWVDALVLGIYGSAVVYLSQPVLLRAMDMLSPATLRVLASFVMGALILSGYKTLAMLSTLHNLLEAIEAGGGALPGEAREPEGVYRPCLRLLNAYPRMVVVGHERALLVLHQGWHTTRREVQRRLKSIAAAFGSKTVAALKASNPFAHGVNFYKLVWVFAIGCVLGYVIETAFCLVVRGLIESRQGMLYGPFSQIYGFGAVLMVLTLYPLSKRGNLSVFIGGALVGGAFEYIASWVQQTLFRTVSWEYSQQASSIGGRTSLLFMFYWGILGLFFIKKVYPPLSNLIESIPRRAGTVLSWVIVVVLSADMAVSALAVTRWIERQHGEEATNAYQAFMDAQYPDALMAEVYPNMMLVTGDGERPLRISDGK